MDALSNLKRNQGATRPKRRLGRGNGSGLGTYSGRGTNGQLQRTGGKVRIGFAGGQTPLYMKMPKLKGFKNVNRVEYQPVNVSDLEKFADNTEINAQVLFENKLIPNANKPVKILGTGELTKKLNVTVNKVSASAKEKIEKAKGSVTELTLAKTQETADSAE